MPLVLAIEPDLRQASILKHVIADQVQADLVLVDTRDAAVSAIAQRIPDIILLPALLAPRDEEELVSYLRGLEGAEHLQTYTIPQLAGAPPEAEQKNGGGLFGRLRRRKEAPPVVGGCEPELFAQEIRAYLERAAERKLEMHTVRARRGTRADPEDRSWTRTAHVDPTTSEPPRQETVAPGESAWASPFEWRPAERTKAAPAEGTDGPAARNGADSPGHPDPGGEAARLAAEASARVLEQERLRSLEQERLRREQAERERAAVEEDARRIQEEEERKRLAAEAEGRRRREGEDRQRQEEEERRRKEDEERKRLPAEAETRRKREEEERRRKEDEERKRLAAEADALRKREEEEHRRREEEQRRRREDEERKRLAAEAEARRKREEEERRRRDEERRRKEEEERKRLAAEAEARRKREEEERRRREEEERRRKEEEERKRLVAETEARRRREEEERERQEDEARRRRELEEHARREQVAREREEEQQRRREAEEAARRQREEEDRQHQEIAAGADPFAEFREGHDEPRGILRLIPVDPWARSERIRQIEEKDRRDDLQSLLAGLTIPPPVALVSYPRGCRIRRVRVRSAARRGPVAGMQKPLILSRRALRESRESDADLVPDM